MEWEIIVHSDENYIEIVTTGMADNDGAERMAKKLAETMRQHRYKKALIDHRNVAGVAGSVSDVYDRPKLFRLIGMIIGIKIAEVILPIHHDHFKFLETVCVNRGYKFSVFYDRTEALHWLVE
jgi:hypothetical protein